MSINNVEIQDSNGNVYYPHTDASVVKYGESDVGSELSENTQNIVSGWTPTPDIWVYASATTFTIVGDKTGTYQKGDKFKLTANGVVLYGYITNVVYSSPNTTITVIGNTLTNYTYTSNYYSRSVDPFGFPDIFSWSSTLTWTTATPTISNYTYRFKIIGKQLFFWVSIGLSDGKGATNLSLTLPLVSANSGSYNIFTGVQEFGSTNSNPFAYNVFNTNVINLGTPTTFINGALGLIWLSGNYEI